MRPPLAAWYVKRRSTRSSSAAPSWRAQEPVTTRRQPPRRHARLPGPLRRRPRTVAATFLLRRDHGRKAEWQRGGRSRKKWNTSRRRKYGSVGRGQRHWRRLGRHRSLSGGSTRTKATTTHPTTGQGWSPGTSDGGARTRPLPQHRLWRVFEPWCPPQRLMSRACRATSGIPAALRGLNCPSSISAERTSTLRRIQMSPRGFELVSLLLHARR